MNFHENATKDAVTLAESSASSGFTLVELMITVAIVGILAAVAIPVFSKYIRNSKAAEADGIIDDMMTGAVQYYTSDQQNCKGDPNCAEPWHNFPKQKGMPVPMTDLVFPGATTTMTTNGGGPPPVGGSKYVPELQATAFPEATKRHLNMDLKDALYFKYTYTASGSGTDAEVTVIAEANFDKTNTKDHKVTQTITVSSGEFTPHINPAYTQREFD